MRKNWSIIAIYIILMLSLFGFIDSLTKNEWKRGIITLFIEIVFCLWLYQSYKTLNKDKK